jgi:abhydrolase domain-containing protein 13
MRIPFIKRLHEKTNSDILLVAYRGYSDSEGKPDEEGLKLDAQAIMAYAVEYRARELAEGRKKDIFVLGRSLGGAVSVYLATVDGFKQQIRGLILENTFTSIQDMVKILFPPLAYLRFLHRNFWPSRERIVRIQAPILFVRCLKDEIVPTSQMEELIKLAENAESLDVYEIPLGTHNIAWEVDESAYFGRLQEYFDQFK